MQFLVLVRRRTERFSDEQFAPLLEPEAQAVRTLYAQGIVRNIWSREDALGAVLLLEAQTPEHAHEAVATLPLVGSDMAEVEKIIPLKGYRGFGPRS
ncbi:MAG TPA: muconolactone Delta-isomerase family protein [Candidatus Baltobacteraceae bacterium]